MKERNIFGWAFEFFNLGCDGCHYGKRWTSLAGMKATCIVTFIRPYVYKKKPQKTSRFMLTSVGKSVSWGAEG